VLLSRYYSESKKALKGHCGSKGRKDRLRGCKKRDGSKETLTNDPTSAPTAEPTAAPTAAATVIPLSDINIKDAVNAWDQNKNYATLTYGSIEDWDVSKVTYMLELFRQKESFDDNVSAWNTERVTTMNGMFMAAYVFNQDLSAWNTERVTDMFGMFINAKKFNQDLCPWVTNNPHFPNDIKTTIMFAWTGCSNPANPTSSNACASC